MKPLSKEVKWLRWKMIKVAKRKYIKKAMKQTETEPKKQAQ